MAYREGCLVQAYKDPLAIAPEDVARVEGYDVYTLVGFTADFLGVALRVLGRNIRQRNLVTEIYKAPSYLTDAHRPRVVIDIVRMYHKDFHLRRSPVSSMI